MSFDKELEQRGFAFGEVAGGLCGRSAGLKEAHDLPSCPAQFTRLSGAERCCWNGVLLDVILLLTLAHELVAYAGHREEELGTLGIFFQLFAQAKEVRVHRAGEDIGAIAP